MAEQRRRGGLVRLAAPVVLLAGALLLPAVPATATLTGAHVEETGCQGITGIVRVPEENVRPVVPRQYTMLVDDETNTVQLDVGAVRCDEVRVYGDDGRLKSARPTLFTTFRVVLCDPDDPPEVRCHQERQERPPDVDGSYVESFHSYTFWITSDNRDLVRLYRERGGVTDRQAVHSTDLVFQVRDPLQDLDPTNDLDPIEVLVEAPSAPSAFRLTAEVGPLAGALNLFGDFWSAVPTGTMIQRPDRLTLFQLGVVIRGDVTPTKKGSEMDRLICKVGNRRSGGPAELSIDDSLRIGFASGEFAVNLDQSRANSSTDRATCDW